MPRLPLTDIAHQAWLPFLAPGAWVIDATAGNGLDTEYLARAVAPDGRVFAFDIQADALATTAERLARSGLLDRVTLIRADHASMRNQLPCSSGARMSLICFNLGYLPSGDHHITTRPESTLPALHEALLLLAPQGALSVMVYRGHDGGREEATAVETFMQTLPAPWHCLAHEATGSQQNPGPVWWLAGARN